MSDNYNPGQPQGADIPVDASQDPITFRIVEHLGVLRASAAGWTRELNLISWNNRPPKFDIREWTPNHEKSGRGLTFTEYEMGRICEWMAARNARRGKTVQTEVQESI